MNDTVNGWIWDNYLNITALGILAFSALILFFPERRHRIVYRLAILLTGGAYLAALWYVTLGNRVPADDYRYNFQVFWSYRVIAESKSRVLLRENIANLIAFLPFGMFLQELSEGRIKWYRCAVAAGALSVSIEAAQLYFKLGLCEWDDVIHNTAGALLGYGLARLIKNNADMLRHAG